ncbi:MAG: zf-TFIIB domain-containing protein [Xanthomonadales bacterium]|nr:zf-TFIIB domain-containing protein [Xanthomonadales bacterium]
MSTPCPSCTSSQLHATALADQLPAESCPDCRGAMLSLIHYRDWRDAHAAPEESVTDAGEASHVDDNKAMLRCPRCNGFMTKFRFSADAANHIDHCDRCDLVWLDHGEWRLVEQLARSGQFAKVFDATWQKRLREEQAKRRAELRWREQLGDDYARAKELRGWLAGHPRGKELLAYLFLSQTEGA